MEYYIGLIDLTPAERAKKIRVWLAENPDSAESKHMNLLARKDEEQAEKDEAAEKDKADALAKAKAENDKLLAEKDKLLAEMDEAAKKDKADALAKAKAQSDRALAEKDRAISQMSLARVKDEYPALVNRTASSIHFSLKHKGATIVDYKDKNTKSLLAFAKKKLSDDTFWAVVFSEDPENCDSESAAQHLVVCLLRSVLKALGLQHLVEVGQNRTLAGIECDILLIYSPNRLPFAALEVKKPGRSKEELNLTWNGLKKQNRVAGQMFDELKAIQLFGFSSVTGMITNGNQWRMVGLWDNAPSGKKDQREINSEEIIETFDSFQKSAKDGTLERILQRIASKADFSASSHSPGEAYPQFSFNKSSANTVSNDRKLWGCSITPSHENLTMEELEQKVLASGEAIVAEVVRFVVLSCSRLLDFLQKRKGSENVIKVQSKMPCRILEGKDEARRNTFAFGSVSLEKLNLGKFNKDLKKIYVIHHLGIGEYGNVCLGVSEKGGSCCAIKFYHEVTERNDMAMAECNYWNMIYKNVPNMEFPYVLTVREGACLVMPYLHPLPSNERHTLLSDGGQIEEALKLFSSSGYIYRDIKWRHFRRLQKTGQILLVDLGTESLHKERNSKAIIEWIKWSIEELRRRAGIPSKNSATTPIQGQKRELQNNTDFPLKVARLS